MKTGSSSSLSGGCRTLKRLEDVSQISMKLITPRNFNRDKGGYHSEMSKRVVQVTAGECALVRLESNHLTKTTDETATASTITFLYKCLESCLSQN